MAGHTSAISRAVHSPPESLPRNITCTQIHGPSYKTVCSGTWSPTNGICTKIVGSLLGNSVKCPAIVLIDLRSPAISTELFTVPGMTYATFVSGRPWSPSNTPQTLPCGEHGAGEVIRISPFKIIDNLLVSAVLWPNENTEAYWTWGAHASPTVVRGSMRDKTASVVLPMA
jgi:hypothetical protein